MDARPEWSPDASEIVFEWRGDVWVVGAQGDAEPRHLNKAAIDQRDSGVGAEAQAIGHAGADGQYVFHGATDLDANHVV